MIHLFKMTIIFSVFLSACRNSAWEGFERKYVSITANVPLSAFPITEIINLKKTGIHFNGAGARMALIDSFLIVVDSRDSILIHILSINSLHEVKQIIKRGLSESELLDVAEIMVSNDSIFWLSDLAAGKLMKINIKKAIGIDNYKPESVIFLKDEAKNSISHCWINDSIFSACSFVMRDLAFYTFNAISNKIIAKIGELPPSQNDWPNENNEGKLSLREMEYPRNIKKRPNRNEYIVAYSSIPRIELYDSNKLKKVLKGPDSFMPLYDFKESKDGTIPIPVSESRFAYMALDVDKNYVYALYSGNANFKTCGSMLLIYNWEGTPIKVLKFNQDYCYFTIGNYNGKRIIYTWDESTGYLVSSSINLN